jgi:hypothetical protein
MNNEFIPYEQALELKELGFDEPCFGWFASDRTLVKEVTEKTDFTLAPTYSQAFRWFRDNYRISPIITCYSELGNAWKYHIPNEGGEQGFNTYEEAELACLEKLIEIVKNK